MSENVEETMKRDNWFNVVVFFPTDKWEDYLIRFYNQFGANEYIHHEVRDKDIRGLAIDIRLYHPENKSELSQEVTKFFQELGINSEHYRFDPKAMKDDDFEKFCGFINSDIKVHKPWTRTRVKGYNFASTAAVKILKESSIHSDFRARAAIRNEVAHLFSWMLGLVDVPVLGIQNEKKVIAVCYRDRRTEKETHYNLTEIPD